MLQSHEGKRVPNVTFHVRENNAWRLVSGKQVVADFAQSEREGRQVQLLLQQFHCTEYCAVGTSGFGFFPGNSPLQYFRHSAPSLNFNLWTNARACLKGRYL